MLATPLRAAAMETFSLTSKVFANTRTIHVLLPAGYDTSHRAYATDPANPIGKKYPPSLGDEVIPAIEEKYRVRRGAENTGRSGWRPDRQLLQDAIKLDRWPSRMYAGVGTAESNEAGVNAEGERDVAALLAMIRRNSPSTRIEFVREEGARQATQFWRARLPHAIEFLFQ